MVEIVTLVAIAGVLLSIVYPVAASVQKKGDASKCASAMRSLQTAYLMAVQDRDGMLVASVRADQGTHVTDQSNTWHSLLTSYLGQDKFGVTQGLPMCPSAPGAGAGKNTFNHGLNGHICQIHEVLPGVNRLAAVAQPSKLALFADAAVVNGVVAGQFLSSGNLFPAARHNNIQGKKAVKIAFLDGHIEILTSNEIPSLNRSQGSGTAGSLFWLGY